MAQALDLAPFGSDYDPPLNAGHASMEEMIDAMIASGKKAAKDLAADCSDIKVEVKCQAPKDGFTKKLNKNPNCNKVVHTEPCAKNAKKQSPIACALHECCKLYYPNRYYNYISTFLSKRKGTVR